MSTFFLSTASFIFLLLIASGSTYLARLWKIPVTVTLVAAGMMVAFFASNGIFAFMDDFEMTPDILFYVFLPILLFESAYNIKYKDLLRNIRSVSALAIISLTISAFFIAGALFLIFSWLHIGVPFIVLLLFGALISSTDTAAVLSIFKELGVPKRLGLIFEGESLFNDGTAIALFLIVLGVVQSQAIGGTGSTHANLFEHLMTEWSVGFGGWFLILKGMLSLGSMIFFALWIGISFGILFSKIIEKVRNDTYIEITLSLILAHATFLGAEIINHLVLPVSGIIATVAAAMVLGNYGRYKISPKVEVVMERYWGFFAFVTNSLVFLLVGMMLVNLGVGWEPLLIPILITIPVVILARVVSVYPVFGFLNRLGKEEKVPRSWQHVLSWGALRGGLAVMMVLLIPVDIRIQGWPFDAISIREFLLSLTIGVVIFSMFVKTITIAPLIRRFHLDRLDEMEEFGYVEARMLVSTAAITKIREIRNDGYIDEEEVNLLSDKYRKILFSAHADALELQKKYGSIFGSMVRRLATLHALGIEKHWLHHLYRHGEIPESVFKNLIKRIVTQIRRVERGEKQILSTTDIRPKLDAFDRLTDFFVDRLEPKLDPLQVQYFEIRAIHLITEKALDGLRSLGEINVIGECSEFQEVIHLYEGFHSEAEQTRRKLFREHKNSLRKLSASLTEKTILAYGEEILADLTNKDILSPKLALRFERKIEGGK